MGYIDKCKLFLEKEFNKKVLMVSSGTAALEIAAFLSGIKDGDEVILPSYTYVSTASSFVKFGAKLKFVDIKRNMCINEDCIESAITKKTKAIIVVHYNGVPCNMRKIMQIAKKYNLKVIEDNAQGVFGKYKEQYLGTIGDYGCLSFQKLKNFNCSEGGAIILNSEEDYIKAYNYINCGTNRYEFFNNQVKNYSWQFLGGNYRMNEIAAKFLYKQFLKKDKIINRRKKLWNNYYKKLGNYFEVAEEEGTANIFYIICKNETQRADLIKKFNLTTHFYPPLHNTKAGLKYGEFIGCPKLTNHLSYFLLRLPLNSQLSLYKQNKLIKNMIKYIKEKE